MEPVNFRKCPQSQLCKDDVDFRDKLSVFAVLQRIYFTEVTYHKIFLC